MICTRHNSARGGEVSSGRPYPSELVHDLHMAESYEAAEGSETGNDIMTLGKSITQVRTCSTGMSPKYIPRDGVEFLDRGSPEAGQRPEDGTFDFRDFRVLNSVNQGILRLGGMVLKFLRGVLFSERRNFVEVHLQVVGHFVREANGRLRWLLLIRFLQERLPQRRYGREKRESDFHVRYTISNRCNNAL